MEPMDSGVLTMPINTIRLLVVCLGNICRSPAFEAILKSLIKEKGLESHIHIESRGLSAKQVGKKIYPPISDELLKRGYAVSLERLSTLLTEKDFFQFDYILAVDAAVLASLQLQKPANSKAHLDLVSCWSPVREEIFDPYKESEDRMSECIDLIEKHAKYIVHAMSKS
jgi:protein-tyrosine phosphatase